MRDSDLSAMVFRRCTKMGKGGKLAIARRRPGTRKELNERPCRNSAESPTNERKKELEGELETVTALVECRG